MELVQAYIGSDYRSIFQYVKKQWLQKHISATPDMAAFIEQKGITRHDYRKMKTVDNNIHSIQEFYKSCLALLIYIIDAQEFAEIDNLFHSEENIMKELGR